MTIKQAHGLDYGFADDGSLVLILLDADGAPFATVTMDEDGADELSCFIDEHLFPDDEIGEVVGHA